MASERGLEPVAIESIGRRDQVEPVYTLTVDACHNYFAGSVLAHNK
ncbi:MAG: hypothetical protein R6X02_20950 [Enhygromyxa sp.]